MWRSCTHTVCRSNVVAGASPQPFWCHHRCRLPRLHEINIRTSTVTSLWLNPESRNVKIGCPASDCQCLSKSLRTSSRKYSPTSLTNFLRWELALDIGTHAGWKTTMDVGSIFRVSTVDRSVTPKPYHGEQSDYFSWDDSTDQWCVVHTIHNNTLMFRCIFRYPSQVCFWDMVSVQERHWVSHLFLFTSRNSSEGCAAWIFRSYWNTLQGWQGSALLWIVSQKIQGHKNAIFM